MPLRIAYLVNQYPKNSHTFIRREILALERHGVEICRIALRGWDAELVNEEDRDEQARTSYALKRGIPGLAIATLRVAAASPARFMRGLQLAGRMAWRGDRSLPYHLAYLAEACQILLWLKANGATHVHAHFGTNSAEVAMIVRELGGPPYSFTVHGSLDFDRPKSNDLAIKIRHADFVVAVSSYGRSQLYRLTDFADWHKVKVVHCGLEASFFPTDITAPPPAPRLICIGRFCEQKGHLLLIEAAHSLAMQKVPFEIVLVGDGELRGEIEVAIRDRALQGKVQLTGWLSSGRIREELLRSRGLVVPSFSEGLPVVIMEAMALRRPVIGTFVAGIPELVRPGVTGWLVPAGSVSCLVSAIKELLASSVGELTAMGAAGFERAVAYHSVDIEAGKLAALFHESGSLHIAASSRRPMVEPTSESAHTWRGTLGDA